MSLAGVWLIEKVEPLNSTYVCSDEIVNWIRLAQLAGVLVEAVLLFVFDRILHDHGKDEAGDGRRASKNVMAALLVFPPTL